MTPEQTIERLRYLRDFERKKYRDKLHEKELKIASLEKEIYDLKVHSIRTSGKYRMDYVMYCMSEKMRIEDQYARLQTIFHLTVKELDKYKEFCRHFTFYSPEEFYKTYPQSVVEEPQKMI